MLLMQVQTWKVQVDLASNQLGMVLGLLEQVRASGAPFLWCSMLLWCITIMMQHALTVHQSVWCNMLLRCISLYGATCFCGASVCMVQHASPVVCLYVIITYTSSKSISGTRIAAPSGRGNTLLAGGRCRTLRGHGTGRGNPGQRSRARHCKAPRTRRHHRQPARRRAVAAFAQQQGRAHGTDGTGTKGTCGFKLPPQLSPA